MASLELRQPRRRRMPNDSTLLRLLFCWPLLVTPACGASGTRVVVVNASGALRSDGRMSSDGLVLLAPDSARFVDVWRTLMSLESEGHAVRRIGTASEEPTCTRPDPSCGAAVQVLLPSTEAPVPSAVNLMLCSRGVHVSLDEGGAPWSGSSAMVLPDDVRVGAWLDEHADRRHITFAVEDGVAWDRASGLVRRANQAGYSTVSLTATSACARFAPGPPTGLLVRGSMSRESVLAFVREHQDAVAECGARAEGSAKPRGMLTVRFIIGPDGVVSAATVVGQSFGETDPEVEACVRAVVRQWVFPTGESGVTMVNYPFEF